MSKSHLEWREEGARGLTGHEKSFDKLSLHDVTFHDFFDVRF
jgi:hypothetical protein